MTPPTGAPALGISGNAAFDITSNTCTAALPGAGSCAVGVTYTGTGAAEQTAQLTVATTPGGTVTADLTGSPQALTIAPTSRDFGGVLVGESSDTDSFTLTNHRLTAVLVNGEGISGPFAVDTSCFVQTLSRRRLLHLLRALRTQQPGRGERLRRVLRRGRDRPPRSLRRGPHPGGLLGQPGVGGLRRLLHPATSAPSR